MIDRVIEHEQGETGRIYGTLPDWAIADAIEKGEIGIDPLLPNWKETLGSVTIDFHLGRKVLIPNLEKLLYIDVRKGVQPLDFQVRDLAPDEPLIIAKDQFIITETTEYLTLPDNILGRLEGRSSLARIGLVIHLTSGRFDPGWRGRPVLEIKNESPVPIVVYGDGSICAFSFERLMAGVSRSYDTRGRYLDPDRIHSLISDDVKSITP